MVKNLRLLFMALLCAVFNTSMAYETVSVPYEEELISSQGKFVIEDVTLGGLEAVWTTSQYGMTANGYKCTGDVESWFVSPLINATAVSTLTLTFEQNLRYFANTDKAKEEATLWVREGENGQWQQLTIPNLENVNNNTFSNAGDIDLSAYTGKTFQLGFKYTATTTNPGRWEIKNISVKSDSEVIVEKEDPELSFGEEKNIYAFLNEENEFPTLINPHGLTVTYSSNREGVATIDAETGEITLVAEGNTQIKASSEETDEFKAGSATYTLYVQKRAVPGTDVYELVTSVNDLSSDNEIIIVNEESTYAISNIQNTNNRSAGVVVEENDGTIIPSDAIARITLEGQTGAWNFKVTTGDATGYLYAASSGNNWLRTEQAVDEDGNANAAIEIDDNGVATITFIGTFTRNTMRYNPNNNNPIFSCYASTSTTGTSLRIYKKQSSEQPKKPAELSYSESEVIATIGEDNEFPELSNPNGLTVTYSSSDEDVATINENGIVTLVAAGTTVIKATSEETDEYKAGSASYTLKVEEIFNGKTYELVTNANVLKAGDNIIIVSPNNDYAMSTSQANNYRGITAVTLADDNTITSTAEVADIVLGGEAGAWTFEVTNGDSKGYLYAPGGGNYLRTTADPTEVCYEATININNEGNAEINFVSEDITQTSIRYNASASRFSCYDPEKSTVPRGRIYRVVSNEVEVEITAVGYATMYYGKKNLTVPAGVSATTYTADNTGIKVSKTYASNEVIPAGTAVVLEGEAGIYSFAVTTEAGTADTNNMLYGFDDKATTVGPDENTEYTFYILSTDKNGENVGFYFKEEDGAAFNCAPHKAYLAVPSEVAASFYTFDNGFDGIQATEMDQSGNNEVYTLSGIRVNGKLQKGIYIVNGKKVVIK